MTEPATPSRADVNGTIEAIRILRRVHGDATQMRLDQAQSALACLFTAVDNLPTEGDQPATTTPDTISLTQLAARETTTVETLIQVATDLPHDKMAWLLLETLKGETVVGKDLADEIARSIGPWLEWQEEQSRNINGV